MHSARNGSASPRLHGAIVGLGRMGLTHLAILRSHPLVGALSVVETSSCFARAVEKNLNLRCYRSLDELLQAESPDFLILATPTSSHYAIARAALEKGIHAFIEKPLSLSAAESASLVELARAKKVVVQVGYVNRFNEVFCAVRSLLLSGELGAPTRISCEIRSPMVVKSTAQSWRALQSEGGGCLYDIASHGVDLMNFFVGPPTAVVGATLQSLVSQHVEDNVEVLFAYPNNLTGTLHVNWSDPSLRKPAYRIVIDAQKGRIVADQHAYKVFRTGASSGQAGDWATVYIPDIAQPVRLYVRGNEFTRQLDNFIESLVLGTAQGPSDIASAAQVDNVIEQIRNAGQRVSAQ